MRLLSLSVLLSMVAAATAHADPALLREELIDNLTFMKGVYRAEYAPTSWKKSYANWDLDTEATKALEAAKSTPDLNVRDAQKIVRSFIYSMKDYHTSVGFQSTEAATLPLVIRGTGAAGKYFVAYIDRTKLSQSAFPFSVGDEVVTFGGVATADAVASVQAEIPGNVAETDRMRAESALTSRSGVKGYVIPQGPIVLGVKPQGGKFVKTVQLIWDYSSEKINDPFALPQNNVLGALVALSDSQDFLGLLDSEPGSNGRRIADSNLLHPQMSVPIDGGMNLDDTPFTVGARKAFTPALGLKLWESDPTSTFHAYMYRTPDRHIIGYIRIPSYTPSDKNGAVAEFEKIIGTFEQATDALVIDQVNNPGGSVFYLYSLASMLTETPLATPRHRMSVAQADVLEAHTRLAKLEHVANDDDAQNALGATVEGFPVNYEFAQFTKSYLRFLISEFKAGRTLTQPYWIEGADHINPAPTHYTHPILLVINNLDFSGGDFFPAILQDNKRVTVFGSRTAGAGGYVNDITFPNDLGIARIRCTESIAERLDKNPIENLGVTPDIAYTMSEDDLTGGYRPYAKAINAAVLGLIPADVQQTAKP